MSSGHEDSDPIKADAEDQELLEAGGVRHKESSQITTHRSYNSSVTVKITLSFVVIGLICLILNQSSYPTQLFPKSNLFHDPENNLTPHSPKPTSFHDAEVGLASSNSPSSPENNILESVLKSASMEGDHNRTVILTTVNAAWTEPNSIFDLFMESFKIGYETEHLLKHVIVVALDEKTYSRCLEVHLHCYRLITKGVDFSGEAHFMSDDYLKMMFRRIAFLRVVLELGYNFVFTDSDVMWLRDPFQRFYKDVDFQIASDHYWFNNISDPAYLDNSPNGGFNYVRANHRTIEFYKYWYNAKDFYPGKHDQDVLNMIKKNPFVTKQLKLQMRYLDTAYFGGFCEPTKDLDLVITMHANCCIGIETKMHDLKMVIDDWKRYTATPIQQRNITIRSWTVPRLCY